MARGVRRVVTGTVADHAASGVRYDTFLLMGENLGLLESATRAPAFLAELAAIAAPGAQIIGHGVDPLRTGHPAHSRYFARNSEIGKLPGQMTLRIRHGDIATPWFDYLLAAPPLLRELTAGTPWTVTAVHISDPVNYLAVLAVEP